MKYVSPALALLAIIVGMCLVAISGSELPLDTIQEIAR